MSYAELGLHVLFAKPVSNLKFEDVEEFCDRFHEGIRIEYKSTLDNSVKSKLPKVVSSFANSYGGILIIGIDAPSGVPRKPYVGVNFSEREPGLTVQNICRSAIFPEVPFYTSLVHSRAPGKAFLVVEVNESPRAPHAIENSTLVYVRSEGPTERMTLADIGRIERMLLRRQDVFRRWDDFFDQSWKFAQSINMGQKYAYREVRIGPLYPAEALITREAVYEFLSDATNGSMAGFALGKVVRSPIGAMATRAQNVERFLNIGDLGIMHYVEPCYPSNYEGGTKDILDFWSTAVPILRLTRVAGALFEQQKASCNLRIEAHLRKITGQSFWSGPNPNLSLPITTVSDSVPALSQVSSCDLPGNALNITVDLMYQLRWPFGEQAPPPMTNVREVVQKLLANV